MINKKQEIKILLVTLFVLLFIYQFTKSTQESEQKVDTSNYFSELIEDEITPYCDGLNYRLEDYKFSDINNLKIEINDSRLWYENLINFLLTEEVIIDSQYKKRFKSKIIVTYNNDVECSFEGRVRISGDFDDHIQMSDKPMASMDIHLDNGNILGITKFKLFLNDTRGTDDGENEVLISIITRQAGFISPRTAIVPVKVNNSASINYIFQEKAAKEMLEFHGFREGPILETNEKYLFEFEWFSNEIFDEERNYFLLGKIINKNWFQKNFDNLLIGSEALQLYNQSIYSSYNPNDQLNYNFLSSDPLEMYIYDILNFSLNSYHGIINHNRKFYFDKMSENFIPIYYDGNSKFLTKSILNINPSYKNEGELAKAASYLLKNYNFDALALQKLFASYRLDYDIKKVEWIIQEIQNNLMQASQLSNSETQANTVKENLLAAEFHDKELLIFNEESYQICNQNLTICTDPKIINSFSELIGLIEERNLLVFGNDIENIFINKNKPKYLSERKTIKLANNVTLNSFEDPTITVDKENKMINIFIENVNQKVLINGGGLLDNWNIKINSTVSDKLINRQDSLLLTGCLTFANIEINQLSVDAKNQHCEDAVNFIRTSGNIDSIMIENSMNDGLDVDYSNLTISYIKIKKSGNDCADLSSGKYNIEIIHLFNCKDKGISIGEKSNVEMFDAKIEESYISLAIKDSSIAKIKTLYSDATEVCIAMYRKKQEFGPSYSLIENNMCDINSINFIQEGSIYDG